MIFNLQDPNTIWSYICMLSFLYENKRYYYYGLPYWNFSLRHLDRHPTNAVHLWLRGYYWSAELLGQWNRSTLQNTIPMTNWKELFFIIARLSTSLITPNQPYLILSTLHNLRCLSFPGIWPKSYQNNLRTYIGPAISTRTPYHYKESHGTIPTKFWTNSELT